MLKVMRDSFHHLKWVLLAVVAAFVFGFVFIDMGLGGGYAGRGGDERTFAARVNGETISYSEYYRALKNYEDMYRQMYGQQFTPEMATAMGLPRQVLEALVDQRLLSQQASKLHLAASPEEIRARLLELPTFSQDGKFVGMELYTRYVTGPLGYPNTAAFEEDLGREIALQKMDSALTSTILISPKAAEAEYRRMNENAKIRWVLLPAAQQAATVTVTPAEVETFYKNNQARYTHGEQRLVRYLLADYAKVRALINPTEQELRQRYEAERDRYKAPAAAHVLHILVKVDPGASPQVQAAAKAKADAIVQQLRGGAEFATLARANSEDPSSAGNGGDMGWVEMGQTVEPFEKAIFSLPLNTVGDPIRTQEYGYHIVSVRERRGETVRPFEEVRAELTSRVGNEKASQQAKAEMDRIEAQLKSTKPANVDAFVALANDKVTSNDSGWFQKTDAIEGIGSHPQFSQWAFSAKKGETSGPIGTPRGIAIGYLTDVRPAGVSSLAEVQQRVEQDVRMEKARDAARDTLAQAMAGATSIDQIAQKLGQQPREASVSRQGNVAGLNGDVSQLVEGALAANAGELKSTKVDDGAVAFQVVEQKKVTPADLQQNLAAYIDNMRSQQSRSLRTTLIQQLRKAASIEMNDEITRPTTAPVPPAGV